MYVTFIYLLGFNLLLISNILFISIVLFHTKMKIRKVISTKVYNKFKFIVCMFIGMMGINYLADKSVTDLINYRPEDSDMSDYGIFVNADGDMVEQGE